MTQDENRLAFRRKRVKIIKRVIMGTILAAIIVPTLLCIVLGVRVSQLKRELYALKGEIEASSDVHAAPKDNQDIKGEGEYSTEFGTGESEYSTENNSKETDSTEDETKESSSVEETTQGVPNIETKPDGNNGAKKVYLTFDDGPSENTDKILDILKKYDVKATFFVVGRGGAANEQRYKRIVEEGHTLAIHSASHDYRVVYANLDSFIKDVTDIRNYVYSITGYMPTVYRFPGGSSNSYFTQSVTLKQCVDWLHGNGIEYFDWNVSSQDAVTPILSVEQIMANIMEGANSVMAHDYSVVLMHDEAHKTTTVEALPVLIEKLKEMGCEILPITDETPAIHHR